MSESKTEGAVPGACLCGAVQYQIDLPTLGSVHCHCTMCRRWNGVGYTTWCAIEKDPISPSATTCRSGRGRAS
jgi:hypothetical protein